jgi:ACS family hexuronate transporter-like MFS transporter
MSVTIPDLRLRSRSTAWKWWVCGLLLLATMVNYMDRLTLNQLAKPLMTDFGLTAQQYGQLESVFGVAFALGAILMGWLADRCNVRWIYPISVLVWSLAGFLTGLAQGFVTLLACRFLLGLAEAGNWPCALRTTQRILTPAERTLGNSILQSGAAVGAVLTPLIVLGLFTWSSSWRPSFLVIGLLGLAWVGGWLLSVRQHDLEVEQPKVAPSLVSILGWLVFWYGIDLGVHLRFAADPWLPIGVKLLVTGLGIGGVVWWLLRATRGEAPEARPVFLRRFAILAVLVVTINITWHFFRAWLPLFLQNQHGYTLQQFSYFSVGYYASTDAGSLAAGFLTLALARGGLSVHGSRLTVFACCAAVTSLSVVAAMLPAGPGLLALLLVIGFAALGLFPNYYSFSQELTVQHQGKVTGALGCICWMSMSLLHEVVGTWVKQTGSYSAGVAGAGLVPLLGLACLLLFWGKSVKQPEVVIVEDERAEHPHADGIRTASPHITGPIAPPEGAVRSSAADAVQP